ncbi:hypothetical protein [Aureivirga sp. CE67]|uniref:hypothetical protein n=1 Tax=Aureivirga sp. CE67 TaxID=1788983 RepID=UPI0018C9C5ED|nr:hypothetical protein [Aureivirga sp. CE67]
MIFQRKVKYNTSLEVDVINQRLISITEKFHTNSDHNFKFEGKINSTGFNILPTFNYSPNKQLRPEIFGKYFSEDNSTEIELNFQLPSGLKILLIFALILNLGIVILMISLPDLTDEPFWDKWWVIIIFLPIMFFIFNIGFFLKVNKSERILIELLKLR